MEVSNVAKIKDSQRILRPDGWELENINHSDAAMFCACGLRPRVILTRCTERTQLEYGIYAEHKGRKGWDTCANSATSPRIQ